MTHQSAAVAIASTPVLSDFATALRSTPTDSLLGRDRGITVFAPDNERDSSLFATVILGVREAHSPHLRPHLRPARRGKRGTGPGG